MTALSIVPRAEGAIYVAPGGELQLDVRVDGETVWLTQAQIAELFDVGVPQSTSTSLTFSAMVSWNAGQLFSEISG